MRLSQVADAIIDAIEERTMPGTYQVAVAREVLRGLIKRFGDLELNIEIRRVKDEEKG